MGTEGRAWPGDHSEVTRSGPQACRETARLGGGGAWLGKKVLDVSRHVPLVALRSQQKEVVSTPGAATARSLPAVTKPRASLHTRSDRGRAASVRNRKLTTGAIDFGKLFKKTALLRYDLHVFEYNDTFRMFAGLCNYHHRAVFKQSQRPGSPRRVRCSPSLLPGPAGLPCL